MGRVAVTDGMDKNAIKLITDQGHEVIEKHYSREQLLDGVLAKFDAVVIRSATKLDRNVVEASVRDGDGLKFIGRAGVGNISCFPSSLCFCNFNMYLFK